MPLVGACEHVVQHWLPSAPSAAAAAQAARRRAPVSPPPPPGAVKSGFKSRSVSCWLQQAQPGTGRWGLRREQGRESEAQGAASFRHPAWQQPAKWGPSQHRCAPVLAIRCPIAIVVVIGTIGALRQRRGDCSASRLASIRHCAACCCILALPAGNVAYSQLLPARLWPLPAMPPPSARPIKVQVVVCGAGRGAGMAGEVESARCGARRLQSPAAGGQLACFTQHAAPSPHLGPWHRACRRRRHLHQAGVGVQAAPPDQAPADRKQRPTHTRTSAAAAPTSPGPPALACVPAAAAGVCPVQQPILIRVVAAVGRAAATQGQVLQGHTTSAARHEQPRLRARARVQARGARPAAPLPHCPAARQRSAQLPGCRQRRLPGSALTRGLRHPAARHRRHPDPLSRPGHPHPDGKAQQERRQQPGWVAQHPGARGRTPARARRRSGEAGGGVCAAS